MAYVNGFVAAVPTANRAQYVEHASTAAAFFKEQGALEVMECWGAHVPEGAVTSFAKAVKCTDDETVVFSWIVWPSKEVADRALEAIADDPRMSEETNPMPFDAKRLIYGGFEPVVRA